nr:MAG TPA: hypothetical protein [Caudoviricetes sp.]
MLFGPLPAETGSGFFCLFKLRLYSCGKNVC